MGEGKDGEGSWHQVLLQMLGVGEFPLVKSLPQGTTGRAGCHGSGAQEAGMTLTVPL